jgi:anti-sigma-K factor RskA
VLTAEFEALVTANQAKFADLAKVGTAPDPLYLVHARINALIDSIATFAGPNGPRWAVVARLSFERQIAAELAQVGPVARRMQLAEGARYTPAMIRALAAQTGTMHRAQ